MTGMAFFLASTSDMEGRWTANMSNDYLTQDKKDLEGWLPDPGGIIYGDTWNVQHEDGWSRHRWERLPAR